MIQLSWGVVLGGVLSHKLLLNKIWWLIHLNTTIRMYYLVSWGIWKVKILFWIIDWWNSTICKCWVLNLCKDRNIRRNIVWMTALWSTGLKVVFHELIVLKQFIRLMIIILFLECWLRYHVHLLRCLLRIMGLKLGYELL